MISFFEPPCEERGIVATTSSQCLCTRACEFIRTIISIFMSGFEKKIGEIGISKVLIYTDKIRCRYRTGRVMTS